MLTPSLAKTFLEGKGVEPGLTFATGIIQYGTKFRSLGVTTSSLQSQVRDLFIEFGMISGTQLGVDPMAEILHARYDINKTPVWRAFFSGEYLYALRQLIQAEKLFHMGRSQWLNYQNSFNNTAFLALQEHLNRLVLPGACNTKTKHGELINFGNMLSPPHPFATNEPAIAVAFDAARRCPALYGLS